jgi:transposase-like protein
MYLWRAVDHEGEVLEILVQRRGNKRAAVKLMRKLLRKQGFAPKTVTTDKLRLTALPSSISGFPATMSRGCDRTIEPRTRTRWCDDESASCSASNHRALPSASSACGVRSNLDLVRS